MALAHALYYDLERDSTGRPPLEVGPFVFCSRGCRDRFRAELERNPAPSLHPYGDQAVNVRDDVYETGLPEGEEYGCDLGRDCPYAVTPESFPKRSDGGQK